MGSEDHGNASTEGTKKRKVESTPPDGYVCRLCSIPGHWIQVCPTKKTGAKRQKKSDHVPVPGKDPSPEDIEKAKELQKVPPPKCFCGVASRLNRVKRSKEGGDTSRAIGKYFFFCSKKRDDETQCRFARPVEMELNKKKAAGSSDRGKKPGAGGARDKKQGVDAKKADKPKQKMICKFFAKSGNCKKGEKCEFSHDVQAKKAPEKAKEAKPKVTENVKGEKNGSGSSSDDSSSDSGTDESIGSSSSSDESKGGKKIDDGSDKAGDGSDSGDSSSSEEDSD